MVFETLLVVAMWLVAIGFAWYTWWVVRASRTARAKERAEAVAARAEAQKVTCYRCGYRVDPQEATAIWTSRLDAAALPSIAPGFVPDYGKPNQPRLFLCDDCCYPSVPDDPNENGAKR